MSRRPHRLATRALILDRDRLLLVNAWPGGVSDLWCAPGGGAEVGHSLPANLVREVHEETGLTVTVGAPALVNEYHDPATGFHQVEVFFRCTITGGTLSADWRDPEGVVTDVESRTAVSFLKFGSSDFAPRAVVFPRVFDQFAQPFPDAYKGKRVRIQGRVQLYDDYFEVILNGADQITVLP